MKVLFTLPMILLTGFVACSAPQVESGENAEKLALEEVRHYCKAQGIDCNRFHQDATVDGPDPWLVTYRDDARKVDLAVMVYPDGETELNTFPDP